MLKNNAIKYKNKIQNANKCKKLIIESINTSKHIVSYLEYSLLTLALIYHIFLS